MGGLKINTNKTQFIFVGSRQYIDRIPSNLVIRAGTSLLNVSKCVKNLGLYIDSNLTFNGHIESICKKANSILVFLNRHKESFDFDSRKMVVESLVLSLFSYCAVLWGGGHTTLIQKVQRIQNFAAKIAVGGGKKSDRATPFIKKLEWLKIKEQIEYDLALFMFKQRNLQPSERVIEIETVGENTVRITRQTDNLVVKRTRTKLAERALSVRGPVLWNTLPSDVKESETINSFKRKLKGYFLDVVG